MPQDRSTYVELGYSGDFGLTGLTEHLCSADRPAVDLPTALAVAAGSADGSDGEEAVELGEDARRLLDGPLSEEVLHTVWLAAVGRIFDPADHGMDTRAWLRSLSDLTVDRLRQNRRSYVPPPVRPVRDAGLCREVVAEIRGLAADLTGACAAPDLVPGLEQVVTLADADVGFRLFLRALKACSVRVSKERYDRFLGLGERLGYPVAVVRDGLDVDWPPIDTTRRDTAWDFGLSLLAGNAHQDWRAESARREIHQVADGDEPGQSPGTAAALLLEDALRLLHSPLSDDTLTTLWVAVSDAALRVDGRDWLRLVADVCEERLGEVAPAYTPAVPPVRTEGADLVLPEVREAALAVADKAVSPHWRPLPARKVTAALEQVAGRVDPDLGFRLFLRVLRPLSVPVTREQYQRYRAIGERFGYGEHHVDEIEPLVR
ncbi:hypothetical protein [Streptomyces sp. Tu 3180]|uniref:hypothetical protein n=1 Tax=Streptomyces sp. Tu 3180 TaxID=2682611 RepID=UPI00135C6B14|nr:hypothetical protein [Streptomyces sp. Tu 3180]KAF3467013.1 hypothetical protein GL259_23685 [Streptomyces sp. Tu 3180]